MRTIFILSNICAIIVLIMLYYFNQKITSFIVLMAYVIYNLSFITKRLMQLNKWNKNFIATQGIIKDFRLIPVDEQFHGNISVKVEYSDAQHNKYVETFITFGGSATRVGNPFTVYYHKDYPRKVTSSRKLGLIMGIYWYVIVFIIVLLIILKTINNKGWI
jgi:hypothetical protein